MQWKLICYARSDNETKLLKINSKCTAGWYKQRNCVNSDRMSNDFFLHSKQVRVKMWVCEKLHFVEGRLLICMPVFVTDAKKSLPNFLTNILALSPIVPLHCWVLPIFPPSIPKLRTNFAPSLVFASANVLSYRPLLTQSLWWVTDYRPTIM